MGNKKWHFYNVEGRKSPSFCEKIKKNAFFWENILSVKKKAVPLHRFSADVI